jgi:hypothetical protein
LDNWIKILLVVAVIIVAAVGVSSGFLFNGYLTVDTNNTTVVNDTNTSVNQTNTTTTTTTQNANYIGTEEAIKIGKTVLGDDPHIKYYAELYTDTDVPYYLVGGKIYNEMGEEISQTTTVKVDAETGEIL